MANLNENGLFDSDKGIWYQIATSASEYTISGLQVKLAADTAPGDLVVTVSGSAGASGQVVLGTIKARATAAATNPDVKVNSLSQVLGEVTITEAATGSFLTGTIVIKFPTEITVKSAKYAVNGGSEADATVTGNTIVITPSLTSRVDTIKITGIKADIGSRPTGEIKLGVTGTALNNIVDNTDTVISVAAGTVVSATKSTASFVIGATDYTVNGNKLTMDVAPIIKDGRTFLPVRYVAQALGVSDDNIIWDGVNETVTLLKGDKVVQLKIGSKTLLVNGVSITMDVSAELVSGRTMLPFRAIAQALGATVGWDEATQTVTLK